MTVPITLIQGDALDALPDLADSSIDAVITDPPYELGFMGRAWDASGIAYNVDLWKQCLRVLKPGGHLLAFGGSRTYHRLAVAVEDAGFEIRDSIMWIYGSGFPKSLDVSKAIDKAAGAERLAVARIAAPARNGQAGTVALGGAWQDEPMITAPATDDAKRWAGWGTALKPAFEPIVVARKPLVGTVAANVLAHGTGALNIDACRVEAQARPLRVSRSDVSTGIFGDGLNGSRAVGTTDFGRWPANVVMSHAGDGVDSDLCADGCVPGCSIRELDEQSGVLKSGANPTRRSSDKFRDAYGEFAEQEECVPARGVDIGGASRFFPVFRYQAKAPTRERVKVDGVAHPTVKPLELMRWLVRLVTPPGGLVLDPFAGSGTTLEAAALEGMDGIGIEREANYLPLIAERMRRVGADLSTSTAVAASPQPSTAAEWLAHFGLTNA